MKLLYCSFLLTLSINLYTQPGDDIGWKINQITEINALLKVDSGNRALIWQRLDLLYNPHFNLYSQTKKDESVSVTIAIEGELRMYDMYKNLNILDDINYLLSDTTPIKLKSSYKKTITNSDLYYKRGQYYYLNGKPRQALIDYLAALELAPETYLKNRICISIAAYYYNLDANFNLSNLEKALVYIDRAIPQEIEQTPETFERFTDRNHHPFEREKIMLLKVTKKDNRLKNYLKSLAKSHLHLYSNKIKESEEYKNSHSYSIPHTLETGLDYLFQIAENYYKAEEFEKSKTVLELVTFYIPKNQINYLAYDKYYSLLAKVYAKNCCKNTSLEINNILNISGSPNYNLRGKNSSSVIKQIDEFIKINAKNPKLFLAKAILTYKDDKLNPRPAIINLLDTAKKLGLIDYRIPYLKGLIFKQQFEYAKAITEFDKAIAIFENDQLPYRAKLEILQKIPNYDEAKVKAIQEKIKSLPFPVSNKISKLIKQIDSL